MNYHYFLFAIHTLHYDYNVHVDSLLNLHCMTLHFAGGFLQSAILFQIALGLRYVQTCPFVFGASKKFYVKKQKNDTHIIYTILFIHTPYYIYNIYICVFLYLYK